MPAFLPTIHDMGNSMYLIFWAKIGHSTFVVVLFMNHSSHVYCGNGISILQDYVCFIVQMELNESFSFLPVQILCG